MAFIKNEKTRSAKSSQKDSQGLLFPLWVHIISGLLQILREKCPNGPLANHLNNYFPNLGGSAQAAPGGSGGGREEGEKWKNWGGGECF